MGELGIDVTKCSGFVPDERSPQHCKKCGWLEGHYIHTEGKLREIDGGGERKPVYATAPDLLKKAAQHMADRAATYDKPEGERSMGKAVEAFNAITGKSLTEAEGWLLLQVLKDVRLWQRPGYHADSAEDCIAYSALKAEAKQREA